MKEEFLLKPDQIGTSDDHINPLNAELNPICHLLALLGAHHILHIRRKGLNNKYGQSDGTGS